VPRLGQLDQQQGLRTEQAAQKERAALHFDHQAQ
jgi:hypothetical protein